MLRISSGLSIVGSFYVLLSLIGTKERRQEKLPSLFNRILLGLCVTDLLGSFALLFGQWAMPSLPPGDFDAYYR